MAEHKTCQKYYEKFASDEEVCSVCKEQAAWHAHQPASQGENKSIGVNGLPRLGVQQGSPADASIPTDHEEAKFVSGIFRPIDKINMRSAGSIWARALELQIWASEHNIQSFVTSVLYDALTAAGLEKTLCCLPELSVFQLRPDIWIVATRSIRVPIGVVEVKKPTKGILDDSHVAGQIYDYMLRLKSFHGLKFVFGILSTYEEWRVCWLSGTEELAAKTSFEISTVPMVSSPEPPEQAEDTDTIILSSSLLSEQRQVFASPVIQFNDPQLPLILVSVLQKMNSSPIFPVPTISSERPYIVLQEKGWIWSKVQWTKDAALDRRNFPYSTAKDFVLLQDLRGGRDGRVWMACTTSGRACVIKFARFENDTDLSKSALKQATEKLEKEHKMCTETGITSRVMDLSGRPALIMEHFTAVDPTSMDDTLKELVRESVQGLGKKRIFHKDMKWDHVVMRSPEKEGSAPRIQFIDWTNAVVLGKDEDSSVCVTEMLKKLDLA